MIQTSEYCAVGHPDRTCDYIACFLLDRWLEKDIFARVALEVQLKDHFCTVSGEVSSAYRFTDTEIADFCRAAVAKIGYTKAYQNDFGAENAICATDLDVTVHISQQSGDIAQGVNSDGWGDPERCFVVMINGIFANGFLARVFAGILLSAIMAAIMSTARRRSRSKTASPSNVWLPCR